MSHVARRWNLSVCWLRGVFFVALFAPVCGAAVVALFLLAVEAISGPPFSLGLLDVLSGFVGLVIAALWMAGPVALLVGVVGTACVLRCAKAGVPLEALSRRFWLLWLVLGAVSGPLVWVITALAGFHSGGSQLLFVFLPTGIVVGLLLAVLFPRALGQPYRLLATN